MPIKPLCRREAGCNGKTIQFVYPAGKGKLEVRYRCANCSALLFSDTLTVEQQPMVYPQRSGFFAFFTKH